MGMGHLKVTDTTAEMMDSFAGGVFEMERWKDYIGVLHRETESMREYFLWQLFTEGIAMVFEQEVVGNREYFHQDRDGWKEWCDDNLRLIKESFDRDLDVMTDDTQRYFGDWVKFNGYGDTGYYLGTKFVRFLLTEDSFDNLVKYDMEEVAAGYERFMAC